MFENFAFCTMKMFYSNLIVQLLILNCDTGKFIIVKSKIYMYRLVAILILVALCHSQFLPKRLRIIDSNKEQKTFLVRGNLPINDKKQFQIDELRAGLSKLTGLKKYKLVVVSILNSFTSKETKNKYIQEKFFDNNPQAGEYRNKMILGSLLDPTEMPNWAARVLGFLGQTVVDLDDVDDFVEELHNEIHGEDANKIVYLHCSQGLDRTGYVAGAYKMMYHNAEFRAVLKENLQILKGHRNHMHFNAQNGLQWFCYHMGRTQSQCAVPQTEEE